MEKIKDDLSLSNNYLNVKNELAQLDSKLIDQNLKKNSDTVEVLLLIKENKRILKSKFKQNHLFAEPNDIIRYFKSNFPNLNENKIKLALFKLGFLPQFIIYFSIAFSLVLIYFISLYSFELKINIGITLICIFVFIILSLLISTYLYPSNIKININSDKTK